MQNLTIFTDASHCPQTGASAGAFWSRTKDKYLRRGIALGYLPTNGAHTAELTTAVNALAECLDSEEYQSCFHPSAEKVLIILVTDCLYVKQALEGNLRVEGPLGERISLMQKRMHLGGIRLKVNHVKAHSGTGTPRKWVNNWCDTEAKKLMRHLRGKKLAQQEKEWG